MRDWQLEYQRLYDQNVRLTNEIRYLRCVMVEAAGSINPTHEPTLFNRLTGALGYFVDERCNPYPEHDDHVSDQYMRELTIITEELGGYRSEFVLPTPRGDEDGEL